MLGNDILEMLACPKCKGFVAYDKKSDVLKCAKCRLNFHVINDVPDMIVEDALAY